MIDRITESSSNFDDLDKMSTSELLYGINLEDSTVSAAVKGIIPSIEQFVDACFERMSQNGITFHYMEIYSVVVKLEIFLNSKISICFARPNGKQGSP